MRSRKGLGRAVVGAALAISAAHRASGADATPRLQVIPLGSSLDGQEGERTFAAYVPTRFGGVLTVTTTAGRVGPLAGPDGRTRENGRDVGTDAHGWYTFTVGGASESYTVSAAFVQEARSARMPWNFYYWPTKADAIHEPWAGGNGRVDTSQVYGDDLLVATPGGPIAPGRDIVLAGPNGLLETPAAPGDDSTWFPNLYDGPTYRGADGSLYQTPCPLLKYDRIFGTAARDWEAAHGQNRNLARWPGHCLGGAVASILLNEPAPAPGSDLTRDELKALWAELGEDASNHRIGESCNGIPAGPPRPGADETDRFAPRVHALLESHIRGRRQALLGNLRAFPPQGMPIEVWNHGIGGYTATYSASTGQGEREVTLDVELVANSGSSLNGQDEKPRVVRYRYTLVYGRDGAVDPSQASRCDWIGVEGEALYCPLNLMEVTETRWRGQNPYVTEANVRELDGANGDGYRRLPAPSSWPPAAPPVASRPGPSPSPSPAPAAPLQVGRAPTPRRGLFSRFLGTR